MKISFIIPVYNVAKYLRYCVKSIKQQSYQELEIILVDDGSTDDSPTICDTFAAVDNRISVIHKMNGGLSDARNSGLQAATGDYIVFVDGDDFWINTHQLKKIVEFASSCPDCDFIGFNCNYYYPDTNRYSPWVTYVDILSKPTDKDAAMIELVKSGTFPMSACLKFMKREFLINNDLFFVKGQIAEDIPWFINVLDKCNKCCFINLYIYAYRQNVINSITNTSGERSFYNLFNIVETEIDKIASRSFNKEAKDALFSFLAYEWCILLTYRDINEETYKKLLSYSWLINYDTNPKVKKVKFFKHIIGLNLTIQLLKLYQKIRQNKK